jgi:hypothetical protein
MRVKIQGGTICHSEQTLCSTCSRSTIIRGQTPREEIIDCHVSGFTMRRITFPVTSCSAYNDVRLPTMMQLMENAWILRRGSKRRAAGFVHSSELRPRELAEIMVETEAGDE